MVVQKRSSKGGKKSKSKSKRKSRNVPEIGGDPELGSDPVEVQAVGEFAPGMGEITGGGSSGSDGEGGTLVPALIADPPSAVILSEAAGTTTEPALFAATMPASSPTAAMPVIALAPSASTAPDIDPRPSVMGISDYPLHGAGVSLTPARESPGSQDDGMSSGGC